MGLALLEFLYFLKLLLLILVHYTLHFRQVYSQVHNIYFTLSTIPQYYIYLTLFTHSLLVILTILIRFNDSNRRVFQGW